MKEQKKIGNISFTEEGYEEFKTLSKEEQVEKVYNSLNPKDYKRAEKLLAHIPNGNISSGVQQDATEDNKAASSAGNAKNSSKGRRAGTEKSED